MRYIMQYKLKARLIKNTKNYFQFPKYSSLFYIVDHMVHNVSRPLNVNTKSTGDSGFIFAIKLKCYVSLLKN